MSKHDAALHLHIASFRLRDVAHNGCRYAVKALPSNMGVQVTILHEMHTMMSSDCVMWLVMIAGML